MPVARDCGWPNADPGVVLDDIRRHKSVTDFGVEAPSLSELFLEATGEVTGVDEVA